MSTLLFDDVTVTFGAGRRAVDAVSRVTLQIPSGSITGIVGESGSGKSTLARAAVGLVEPRLGRILLDGVDVVRARGDAARLRRRIQMVFQDPSSCLDPRRTIGESIDEALVVSARRGGSTVPNRGDRRAEVSRLLSLVGIDPSRAGSPPSALSGGQRQRVALARALSAAPTVLLADEITSALDVSVQGAVLNMLREIHRERGLTILFISHNLAVVRHVCDRIAVMVHGELVETGDTLDVLTSPQTEYTRTLIAAVPEVGLPLFDEVQP